MECRIWSQPDARHWRGLCTNKFQSEGSGSEDCFICVDPNIPSQTCESAGPQSQICRNWDGTPIVGSMRPDQWISTWTPFYTFTISLPAIFRNGAPWYYGTTGNCESFYLGAFTLGPFNWKCGRWTTFLDSPDERCMKLITALGGPGSANCTNRCERFRIELLWNFAQPVLEAFIRFRIFSTDHAITCRYSSAPVSPLQHDCRTPISFQTWRNSAGNWAGSTAFEAISATSGASVTLTPLYL